MCRFQSGAPSDHQTGPRSPNCVFISSILCRAASRPAVSSRRIAVPLSRRACISLLTKIVLRSSARDGLVHRQRRPLTIKYRPSGVKCIFFRVAALSHTGCSAVAHKNQQAWRRILTDLDIESEGLSRRMPCNLVCIFDDCRSWWAPCDSRPAELKRCLNSFLLTVHVRSVRTVVTRLLTFKRAK